MAHDQPVKALVLALTDHAAAAVYSINRLQPDSLCFVLPERAKSLVETDDRAYAKTVGLGGDDGDLRICRLLSDACSNTTGYVADMGHTARRAGRRCDWGHAGHGGRPYTGHTNSQFPDRVAHTGTGGGGG